MSRLSRLGFFALVLPLLACSEGGNEPPATAEAETPETEAAAKPESAEAAPELSEPRNPAELWPELLAHRDRMRTLMKLLNPEQKDLDELAGEIEEVIAAVNEMVAFAKSSEMSESQRREVALGAYDVRTAVAQIRGAVATKTPGMWRWAAPGLDQALLSLEQRFPEGTFKQSIKERAEFSKHLFSTDAAPGAPGTQDTSS